MRAKRAVCRIMGGVAAILALIICNNTLQAQSEDAYTKALQRTVAAIHKAQDAKKSGNSAKIKEAREELQATLREVRYAEGAKDAEKKNPEANTEAQDIIRRALNAADGAIFVAQQALDAKSQWAAEAIGSLKVAKAASETALGVANIHKTVASSYSLISSKASAIADLTIDTVIKSLDLIALTAKISGNKSSQQMTNALKISDMTSGATLTATNTAIKVATTPDLPSASYILETSLNAVRTAKASLDLAIWVIGSAKATEAMNKAFNVAKTANAVADTAQKAVTSKDTKATESRLTKADMTAQNAIADSNTEKDKVKPASPQDAATQAQIAGAQAQMAQAQVEAQTAAAAADMLDQAETAAKLSSFAGAAGGF